MTSLSRPASSRDRWALSLPAHNSIHPKGRIVVREHSSSLGSLFLTFMVFWISLGPCHAGYYSVQVSHFLCWRRFTRLEPDKLPRVFRIGGSQTGVCEQDAGLTLSRKGVMVLIVIRD